jgi:hypothetical protein
VSGPGEQPLVAEDAFFVCADAERLRAMEDAQTAGSDETRLEAALVVTNLYRLQVEHISSDLIPEWRDLAIKDDPRSEGMGDWIDAWTDAAEVSMKEWGAFQEQLVQKVGKVRAEQLAEGVPKARVGAVFGATSKALEERIAQLRSRRSAGDVAENELSPEASAVALKTCPDCAEDVRAAARKCRYCGYRFDQDVRA